MKTYETFTTNCSKCGVEIERDKRWEGRKHECIDCRAKRELSYVQKRDRAFKRLAQRIETKYGKEFKKAKDEGRSKFDVYQDLMDAGIL